MCWIQRPFHDINCQESYDGVCETMLQRHPGSTYNMIKKSLKDFGRKRDRAKPEENLAKFDLLVKKYQKRPWGVAVFLK